MEGVPCGQSFFWAGGEPDLDRFDKLQRVGDRERAQDSRGRRSAPGEKATSLDLLLRLLPIILVPLVN